MPAKPDILLLTLEFPQWIDAAKFTYCCNFGLEEGLTAQGITPLTLPVYLQGVGWPAEAWQACLAARLNGRRFDQVWFEATHLEYLGPLRELLPQLAPVRVAMLLESIETHPLENPPRVAIRNRKVQANLALATHVVAVDEADVARFNAQGSQPAFWWAGGHLPARLIAQAPLPPVQAPGLFHGTLYGERAQWLAQPALAGLLAQGRSAEDDTPYPARFGRLSQQLAGALAAGQQLDAGLQDAATDLVRQVRRATYPVWLASMSAGSAVVNLPQFAKAYASRVPQGMAAGRPVVTWRIADRPRTQALWDDGLEILTYEPSQPAELAEHLKRLQADPAWAQGLAERALQKMRRFHTTEKFVADLLAWVADGRQPDHGDGHGASAQPSPAWRTRAAADAPADDLQALQRRGLWQPGQPLKLHLGCGGTRLPGYINIDYPPAEHNVMDVRPDHEADITRLRFPTGTVDEIRLHHVFEHFSRVNALALLIRWQGWLKLGGRLHIETPDMMGSAQVLLADQPLAVKMGTVRHLAGDQAAAWAYHVDHWFPERFQRTLTRLGFAQVQTQQTRWPHPPHLCNVHALAVKTADIDEATLLAAADELLWDSVVSSEERPTHEVWRRQLRAALHGFETFAPANIHVQAPAQPASAPRAAPAGADTGPGAAATIATTASASADAPLSLPVPVERAPTALRSAGGAVPLDEILDFNQRNRDRWVQQKAATVPAGAHVLDVGAGTCVYRPLFAHCDYRTHDFKQYEGAEKLGHTTEYGQIDHVSDILAIPVADASLDLVLCTEVLEHVPEPTRVLHEFARMLKPGGRVLLTAPLGSGLHQLPFHFYGGYTPSWYQRFGHEAGLDIVQICANGGFFRHLAQECGRAANLIGRNAVLHSPQTPDLMRLLQDTLPRLFDAFDDQVFDDRFTVGYFVEYVRR